MGNDPVLYRTFIPLGRLDCLRLSRPDRLVDSRPTGSRDPLVTEVAPYVT
jgi:hypothetical protein